MAMKIKTKQKRDISIWTSYISGFVLLTSAFGFRGIMSALESVNIPVVQSGIGIIAILLIWVGYMIQDKQV